MRVGFQHTGKEFFSCAALEGERFAQLTASDGYQILIDAKLVEEMARDFSKLAALLKVREAYDNLETCHFLIDHLVAKWRIRVAGRRFKKLFGVAYDHAEDMQSGY